MPEVASRRHLELAAPVLAEALEQGEATLDDVDTVAVTHGPGLIGALLVGLSAAKALAWSRRLPLVPVDHLHGHVASLFLQPEPVEPPFLCLLASGGHTLLLDVQTHAGYELVGTTLDDAAGEAFDKGARLLGLGYPGGAALDRAASEGDPEAYVVPGRAGSRLRLLLLRPQDRTALRRRATSRPASWSAGEPIWPPPISGRSCGRSSSAPARRPPQLGARRIAVVGGVAANSELRERARGRSPRAAGPLYR